jgi:hypothetical protein
MLALLGSAVLLAASLAGQSSENPVASNAAASCSAHFFRGFDSRLHARQLARIDTVKDAVTGFALFHGTPVLSYAHRLLLFNQDGTAAAMPSFKPLNGILTSLDQLRMVGADGLLQFGDRTLEASPQPGYIKTARYAQSATRYPLMAVEHGTNTEFSALTNKGETLPLIAIQGQMHAMSWTPSGFAAIVDNTLITLSSNEAKAWVSPPDPALKSTTSLCMVGKSRALVMLPQTAVLYDNGRRTILATVNHGRCAWDGAQLAIFEAGTGILWQIDNLDAAGNPDQTRIFLQQLAATAHSSDAAGERAYSELARFVGFDKASALSGHPDPCPTLPATQPTPPATRK